MHQEDIHPLRLAGILGIVGTLFWAISDMLLIGAPTIDAQTQLVAVQRWVSTRVILGGVLGVAVIPLWLAGLWPLHEAVRPAGRRRSALIVGGFGCALLATVALRAALPLAAASARVHHGGAAPLPTYWRPAVPNALMYLCIAGYVVGSLWFGWSVVGGMTLFSPWMVMLSPLLGCALVAMLPAPATTSDWLVPPLLGLGWLPLFVASLWRTWSIADSLPR